MTLLDIHVDTYSTFSFDKMFLTFLTVILLTFIVGLIVYRKTQRALWGMLTNFILLFAFIYGNCIYITQDHGTTVYYEWQTSYDSLVYSVKQHYGYDLQAIDGKDIEWYEASFDSVHKGSTHEILLSKGKNQIKATMKVLDNPTSQGQDVRVLDETMKELPIVG